jgi:hypothetical protein
MNFLLYVIILKNKFYFIHIYFSRQQRTFKPHRNIPEGD